MTERVLVVDDDEDQCQLLEAMLGRLGYVAESTTSAEDALERARATRFSAVLTDLEMQELTGIQLCERLAADRPNVPIVVVTGKGSVDTVAAAIRAGAYDYLMKPVEAKQLGLRMARATQHSALLDEVERLRQARLDGQPGAATLGGRSARMRELKSLVGRVATTDASVLIQGETGTGKELVARAIHNESVRSAGPFVAINCAAVPDSLLESELFGHARGAFTDAKVSREGLFVRASAGTLFLDEIGEMPLEMQVKLLRALQERTVRPVGSQHEVPFDVRIIAATHRDLDEEVADGRFRQDLYYRINVVRMDLPALRERSDDILPLATDFLDKFAARAGRPRMLLSMQVAELLRAYEWPGNVRELENCMERLVALGRFDETMAADLPDVVKRYQAGGGVSHHEDEPIVSLETLERLHIQQTVAKLGGNKSRAAELLGLDRRTLYRKLNAYAKDRASSPGSADESSDSIEAEEPSENDAG